MAPFLRNTSYHAINVIGTLRASVPRASRLFERTMAFLNNGFARPVEPVTVMNFSQIEAGFRLLQSGKHVGKVVFSVQDDDIVQVILSGLARF
jgi:NADPH:quinone reductase-like Zn-dependent oxidoreductase